MAKKKLIDELCDFVDANREVQRPFREMWHDVKCARDGDYGSLINFDEYDYHTKGAFVNSQKMYTKTREIVSKLILPADFSFKVSASNSSNAIDVAAAKVAEAHLQYYWRDQDLWQLGKKVLEDAILFNRGYIRVGFKPPIAQDQVQLTADDFLPANSEGTSMPGQPYAERIPRDNLIIEDGFHSIKEAFQTGGRIGIRSFVHIDWVKANPAYIAKAKGKVTPDVAYKGMEPEDAETKESVSEELAVARGEDKWVIIWEIFDAPSAKFPEGRYSVIHKRSNQILFKTNKLPYKGMGFPVRELAFYEPTDSYYAVPISYRALNPLFEHELFESKVMDLVSNMKTILIGNSAGGKDAAQVNDQLKAVSHFGFVDAANFIKGDIQEYSFNPDTIAAERASLRAEARFDSMYGPDVTTPRRGEQIATELRLNNLNALQEINDQKIILNLFWERIARDLINITKTNTAEAEQRRITREIGMTIEDQSLITLWGDYAINIITSPLLDMSSGEELQAINMGLTTSLQLIGAPGVGDRLDLLPMVAKLFDKLGIPKSDIIKGGKLDNASWENSMLVIGNPIEVEASDNHIEHLQVHQRYIDQLGEIIESAQNNPNVLISFDIDNAIKTLNEHIDQHITMGDVQSEGTNNTGAWQQAKNAVNLARQASSFTTGVNAQAGTQSQAQSNFQQGT